MNENNKIILENITDHLHHAVDHFVSLKTETLKKNIRRHSKNIASSMYSMLEFYLYLRLQEKRPEHSLFQKKKKNGKSFYPSFSKTFEELKKVFIRKIDLDFLSLVETVSLPRTNSIHNPECRDQKEVDIPNTAFVFLAILHLLRLDYKVLSKDIFDEEKIEQKIIEGMRLEDFFKYNVFIEEVLKIEYGEDFCFELCPICDSFALYEDLCMACYYEMIYVKCSVCGVEIPYPKDEEMKSFGKKLCLFCQYDKIVESARQLNQKLNNRFKMFFKIKK